jgi:Mn-dependent DtxR family transcriptional regulator
MITKGRDFYTVRGYALLHHNDRMLTPSMEDYLEMAYRLGKDKGYARTSDLAEALNVQPPSVSKMVQKLTEMGFFIYEKYGLVEFTKYGRETGEFLLARHETIEKFLTLIGVTNNILEDTEKIEHNISGETYRQITLLVKFIEDNQQWIEKLKNP